MTLTCGAHLAVREEKERVEWACWAEWRWAEQEKRKRGDRWAGLVRKKERRKFFLTETTFE